MCLPVQALVDSFSCSTSLDTLLTPGVAAQAPSLTPLVSVILPSSPTADGWEPGRFLDAAAFCRSFF